MSPKRIIWSPAAAIEARRIGIEIDDADIDFESTEPHIFACPDCQIVDPKLTRRPDGFWDKILCGGCGRLLGEAVPDDD